MLDAARQDDADDAEITQAEIAAAEAELRAATIDANRMLLDDDEYGREILFEDPSDGTITIERVVDVEPVLEWCRGRYNEGIANAHSEFRQIASLPPEALDVWAKARGYRLPQNWYLKREYEALVMAAVHDRDLSGFRTLAGEYRRRGQG